MREQTSKTNLTTRSPIRPAAIAVLLERPGHAYDVAQRINNRMGPSWKLEPKHIYPVLNALRADSLVRMEMDSYTRQKIYYPTAMAEPAWREWLSISPPLTLVRADVQVRLAFSTERDAPALLRMLKEYRKDLVSMMDEHVGGNSRVTPWIELVVGFTRSGIYLRLEAELNWIDGVCDELERVVAGLRLR